MEVRGSKIMDGEKADNDEEDKKNKAEDEEEVRFLDEKDLKIDTVAAAAASSRPPMKKKDFFRYVRRDGGVENPDQMRDTTMSLCST